MLPSQEHSTTIKSHHTNRVSEWIDYRLPIFTFLRRELHEYPTPRNLNYLWNFGSLSGICLVIMIVTGVALAMHYTPTEDGAFNMFTRPARPCFLPLSTFTSFAAFITGPIRRLASCCGGLALSSCCR